MKGELSFAEETLDFPPGEPQAVFRKLEEKVSDLLVRYEESLEARETLAQELRLQKERVNRLQKQVELLTHDREKVKTRIDQLLHRLKGIDL